MDNKELIVYLESKIKSYNFAEIELRGITTVDGFEEKRNTLLNDVFEDKEFIFEIMSHRSVPAPVSQLVNAVNRKIQETVSFYTAYKALMFGV